jgi:glucosyl-3-phosphoglycerate synthase
MIGRSDSGPSATALSRAKAHLGTTVSVCLPARNEETTIGAIVATVRRTLVEEIALVDEIIVMDDNSTDGTALAAQRAGAVVVPVADVLPNVPAGSGKGNALWCSLYVTSGDIICWLDADVSNFRSDFVTRLLEPLLADAPKPSLVKGYYRRPLFGEPTGGGRVTELMARPLLSSLFPALRHIIQPLGGEYAGRRTTLEAVPFVEGWGVELGLLLDIATTFGVESIVQRDLGIRQHRNRPLGDLGPQAMEILLAGLRRTGLGRVELSSTLARFDEDHDPLLVPVEVRERPPMITIPAYRAKFGRELSA